MSLARKQRREASRAAYEPLRQQYAALPADKRAMVQNEFALQRARSPALSWSSIFGGRVARVAEPAGRRADPEQTASSLEATNGRRYPAARSVSPADQAERPRSDSEG